MHQVANEQCSYQTMALWHRCTFSGNAALYNYCIAQGSQGSKEEIISLQYKPKFYWLFAS